MFSDYVLQYVSAEYVHKILILDDEGYDERTDYSTKFSDLGFEVVRYRDDLSFRVAYEERLKRSEDKILVIAASEDYIPYDIRQCLHAYSLSLNRLFPKLHTATLASQENLDLDLLACAYTKNYDDWSSPQQTQDFMRQRVYSAANVREFLTEKCAELAEQATAAKDYRDWLHLAEAKAKIDVTAARHHIEADTDAVNRAFRDYILTQFGKLSAELNRDTPVLVSRAMEYMHDRSAKFVVIVMDGMSEFDWEVLAQSFTDIPYERSAMFAMIPSTTSISRQCLLAGKYPSQLMEPWKQSKEKQEFTACAKNLGYTDNQISYGRGYDVEFDPFVRCGAVIINDVDEMVHAQHQGRYGMRNDVELLARQGKSVQMTQRFLQNGFDVYITADHGNTPCVGMGKLVGTGVDVETKSHRMVVLRDFADKESLQEKYHLIEYPKYYLDKTYDYLICDVGTSLDAKGEKVMTHGGITLDEVVVPLIQIRAVKENG